MSLVSVQYIALECQSTPQRQGGGHAMEATEVEAKAAILPPSGVDEATNHLNEKSGKELTKAIISQ